MTIRRVPSDFVVEEELKPEFASAVGRERTGSRTHAVYRLVKQSRPTPEAAAGLAKALGLPAVAAVWGGMKDTHACTTQYLSLDVPTGQAAPLAEGPGWSAALLGWSERPMSPAALAGNRFQIIVRDLSQGAAMRMESHARALSQAGGGVVIVNYFGDQRFGSARHRQGFAAAHLIRGDFESALRLLIATPARKDRGTRWVFPRVLASEWGNWSQALPKLPRCPERAAVEALAGGADYREAFEALPHRVKNWCIEAYQSHLWNATARRLVASLPAPDNEPREERLIEADDAFGTMLFPTPGLVPPDWAGAEMPLLSPRTSLREPWGAAAAEVLAEEGIGSPEHLRIPGVRRPRFDEHPRRLIVVAEDFTLGDIEPDEISGGRRVRRSLALRLPPGSFATVVLRALGQ